MCVECFRNEAVLNGRAFLSDLKIAVAVGTFEVMVQVRHQLLLSWFVETDLFREQQCPAWQEATKDVVDDLSAFGWRQELKRQIQYDKSGIADFDLAKVCFIQLDTTTIFGGFCEHRP